VFAPHIQFTEFENVIHQHGIAIAEPGGRDTFDDTVTGVLIGPEGGFDREELDYAVPKIGLGNTVLRVETAAIVAAFALVQHHGG
jgi:16S rRNA U1498 N3-methylase RsmE